MRLAQVREGFAAKFSSSGALLWAWKSNATGDDVANAVVQLPGNGDLLVVGFRTVAGIAKRCMSKIALSTGVQTKHCFNTCPAPPALTMFARTILQNITLPT